METIILLLSVLNLLLIIAAVVFIYIVHDNSTAISDDLKVIQDLNLTQTKIATYDKLAEDIISVRKDASQNLIDVSGDIHSKLGDWTTQFDGTTDMTKDASIKTYLKGQLEAKQATIDEGTYLTPTAADEKYTKVITDGENMIKLLNIGSLGTPTDLTNATITYTAGTANVPGTNDGGGTPGIANIPSNLVLE